MPEIHAAMTVNEVMRRWPATVAVVNKYGLDTCCGGGLTLEQAAGSVGAQVADLVRDLATAAASPAPQR